MYPADGELSERQKIVKRQHHTAKAEVVERILPKEYKPEDNQYHACVEFMKNYVNYLVCIIRKETITSTKSSIVD